MADDVQTFRVLLTCDQNDDLGLTSAEVLKDLVDEMLRDNNLDGVVKVNIIPMVKAVGG